MSVGFPPTRAGTFEVSGLFSESSLSPGPTIPERVKLVFESMLFDYVCFVCMASHVRVCLFLLWLFSMSPGDVFPGCPCAVTRGGPPTRTYQEV